MRVGTVLRGERMLVTGSKGFVGSWLTKSLVDAGAEVVVLDRSTDERSNFHLLGLDGKVDLVRGDLRDYSAIENVITTHEPAALFHLAAQAEVPEANRSPLPTFETNIMGTVNILEACRRKGNLGRIIVASTDKAYGPQKKLPYTEDLPLKAQYPYDVSKMCAERIAYSYYRTYGLPIAIARCSNIYGGGDLNWSRLVPGTIRSILNGEAPVVRSDGTPLRDYLYVEDAIRGYLALASRLSSIKGEAFNFGTKTPISVLDVVAKILGIADAQNLRPIILGEASGEIESQYLDSAKAEEALNWEAKVSLDEGLAETFEWYKRNQAWWRETTDKF